MPAMRSRSPETVLEPLRRFLLQAKELWPEAFEKKLRFGDVMAIMKACDIKFTPGFVVAIGENLGTFSGPADVLRNHCADLVDMETTNKEVCRHWLEGRCRNGESCRYSHDGPGNVAPDRFTPRRPALPGIEAKDAVVKTWNDEKGFGFVTISESGEDVYIHRTALCDGDYLNPGSLVRVDVSWNESRSKNEVKACSGAAAKGVGKGSSIHAEGAGTCCFVGNLPYDTTEEELIQVCSHVGHVTSVRLNYDHLTQAMKGCGFCDFASPELAKLAIETLNGSELRGRTLRVCSSHVMVQPPRPQTKSPRLERPPSTPAPVQEIPMGDAGAQIQEAAIQGTASMGEKKKKQKMTRIAVVTLPVANRRKWRLVRRLEELQRHFGYAYEDQEGEKRTHDLRPDTLQLLAGVQKQVAQEIPNWAHEVNAWTCARPPPRERLQELLLSMRERCRQEDMNVKDPGVNDVGSKYLRNEEAAISSKDFLDSLPAQLLPQERRLFEELHSWMVTQLREKPDEPLFISDAMEVESIKTVAESLLRRANVPLNEWIERRLEGHVQLGLDVSDRYIIFPDLPDEASVQLLCTSQSPSSNTHRWEEPMAKCITSDGSRPGVDDEFDHADLTSESDRRGAHNNEPPWHTRTHGYVNWSDSRDFGMRGHWSRSNSRDFGRRRGRFHSYRNGNRTRLSRSNSRDFGRRGRFDGYGAARRRDRSRSRRRERGHMR